MFKKYENLPKKEQEDLILDLVNAFVSCKNIEQAAFFLQDLLTRKEMNVLAKRLRIAKLLLQGMTYEQIEEKIHVSHSTVAKVALWLADRGEGFRKIVETLPKKKETREIQEISDWTQIKRKYSLYFWPELLLEEVIKSADKKQKIRIKEVLSRLEDKSDLHKRINKLIRH